MRICVTGAHGFVGLALGNYLESYGQEVIRAVRQTKVFGEIAVGDITRETNWRKVLYSRPSAHNRGAAVDAVIHLAARVHLVRDRAIDPLAEFRKVNVDGTLNLARQAAAAGVRRFVFLSSVKVNGEKTLLHFKDRSPILPSFPREKARGEFGWGGSVIFLHSTSFPQGERECFSEVDGPLPQHAYAVSKWEAEQGLMAIAHETGMEVVIIRPPLVYGPGAKGNFDRLVQWARRGVPLPFGALRNRRSLIALDNLVSFVALCADRTRSSKAANEVFLISDGEDVSTPELLRKVARAYGTKVYLIPVPAGWMRFGANLLGKSAMADRLLSSLVIDSSKARKLLGWQPVITMDEQLQKMARDAAPV